jgi:hypothetical protein
MKIARRFQGAFERSLGREIAAHCIERDSQEALLSKSEKQTSRLVPVRDTAASSNDTRESSSSVPQSIRSYLQSFPLYHLLGDVRSSFGRRS